MRPAGCSSARPSCFERADLVFTGGASLYEAKRDRHPDVHLLPEQRRRRALRAGPRRDRRSPPTRRAIPAPAARLLRRHRRADGPRPARRASPRPRPDWQFVMLGPVVKIDPAALPQRAEHPLSRAEDATTSCPPISPGWDVALMPFARNESTRFISPTKTPEYLAAGRPSSRPRSATSCARTATRGLVRIADGVERVRRSAVEAALPRGRDGPRCARRDAFLAESSWDGTWADATDRRMPSSASSRAADRDAAQRVPPSQAPRASSRRRCSTI